MSDDFIEGAEGPDVFDPEVIAARQADAQRVLEDKAEQTEAHMRRLKDAYERVFKYGKPHDSDVETIMLDLMHFCRAGNMTTFSPIPGGTEIYEGRRQVYNRIAEHVHIPYDVLLVKYASALYTKVKD